ncbi:MAG: hypothetical protein ACTTKP_03025 [Catonella sp.]|uniref:hypothetical protein n=1 Tax=Catonella sp. TaxID=2382125 RepID=UPI003F9EC741
MNEIKLLKFETMVEDVDKKIKSGQSHESMNIALKLIFDYDKCNEYARKIIEKSSLFFEYRKGIDARYWLNVYSAGEYMSKFHDYDDDFKIDASKAFIYDCRNCNKCEKYKFIFWSLMILTVDNFNADEYLSTICDFVAMLEITTEEFKDIVSIIKWIYSEEGYFKLTEYPYDISENVKYAFNIH